MPAGDYEILVTAEGFYDRIVVGFLEEDGTASEFVAMNPIGGIDCSALNDCNAPKKVGE